MISVIAVFALYGIINTVVEGYEKYCDINQTLIVPNGEAATFVIGSITSGKLNNMGFRKTDGNTDKFELDGILVGFSWFGNLSTQTANVYKNDSIRNRTDVYIDSSVFPSTITITIRNMLISDNGTYQASYGRIPFYPKYGIYCWILLILDLKQIPSGDIDENDGVRILAQPTALFMNRPLTEATMVWLLDGHLINETRTFLIQDGTIWASKVPRALNKRNITYRAIQDSGEMSEINLTLNIVYGPDSPLSFLPVSTLYTLSSGDTMPDIICAADCNPPCSVTWGEHSSSNVLSLGAVSASTSAEYSCTAKRKGSGTSRALNRSVYILVAADGEALLIRDNKNNSLAFALLGSMQVLTALLLGVLIKFICRRAKSFPCTHCANVSLTCCQQKEDAPVDMNSEAVIHSGSSSNIPQNDPYTGNYEVLSAATGENASESEHYSSIRKGRPARRAHQDLY